VCVFVHYDPGDRLDPYVTRYLSALKGCGLDILLVSSSNLDAAGLAEVAPSLTGAICRENRGLDFSGWALAFELFPQLLDCEALVIANDSVYGPVGDLGAMIARMRGSSCAVWAATRNYEIEEHVQSWFVWFERAALRSDAFRTFWSGVLPLSDKQAIIESYEIPLQKAFEEAGLAVGAATDLMLLQVANGNPTMHPWRRLLAHGCPFVKVQLLRDNPVCSDINGWTEELAARGYPAPLVLDHLRRTAGGRAAALQMR
jgi:lipopolysaccharide biosynthesis protein